MYTTRKQAAPSVVTDGSFGSQTTTTTDAAFEASVDKATILAIHRAWSAALVAGADRPFASLIQGDMAQSGMAESSNNNLCVIYDAGNAQYDPDQRTRFINACERMVATNAYSSQKIKVLLAITSTSGAFASIATEKQAFMRTLVQMMK